MRCPECGQRLMDGALRCPACGMDLSQYDYEAVRETEERDQSGEPEQLMSEETTWSEEDQVETLDQESNQEESYQEEIYRAFGRKNQRKKQQFDMPMKWYKFLIYVSLVLTAFSNIYSGMLYLYGRQYGSVEDTNNVYAIYQNLAPLDKAYGLIMILFGAYAIIVRQKLVRLKKDGPKHLLILYGASIVMTTIYCFLASVLTGENLLNSSLLTSGGMSLVMIILNKIYFDKRAHIFDN